MSVPIVLAIDGNSLTHRSYHAQSGSGQRHWAVRGLLTQLVAAVDRIRPSAVVIGFDDAESSRRKDLWPAYKAQRSEKDPELVDQIEAAINVMIELGVAVVVPDGLEADDVLASVSAFAGANEARAVLVTSDRDAFALMNDHTRVLRIINGGVDASPLMSSERLVTLLGVTAPQYLDFAALRGDPSDNLPGVRGIGPTTAAKLLQEFGTAAAAFDDLDAVRTKIGKGVATKLEHPEARPAWALNCEVMAPDASVPLSLDLSGGTGVLPFRPEAVETVFRGHNLIWSVDQAVEVLAYAQLPRQAPAFPNRAPEYVPVEALPPAPAEPSDEQMSLF